MQTSQKQELYTPQNREIRRCLEAIEAMIKSSTYREDGHRLLLDMDVDTFNDADYVHYHFVQARYYYNTFRSCVNRDFLDRANDYMDELFTVAYKLNVRVSDERYFFTRANVKFELAIISKQETREWLLDKAKAITEKALQNNPENYSFKYLQRQLALVA